MNEQLPLFFEDLSDALRACVQALGGAKKVGGLLRPELPADQAGRWVADCLNEARRDCFHPDQVVVILREARKAGCHAGMAFICGATGYQDPVPVEPEDERAQLQRAFVQGVKSLEVIQRRMEMLGSSR